MTVNEGVVRCDAGNQTERNRWFIIFNVDAEFQINRASSFRVNHATAQQLGSRDDFVDVLLIQIQKALH